MRERILRKSIEVNQGGRWRKLRDNCEMGTIGPWHPVAKVKSTRVEMVDVKSDLLCRN